MKCTVLVFTSLLFNLLNAQKVDLDRFNFTWEYRNLPHSPLDPSYSHYSVLVDVSGNVANSMSSDVVASRIVLQGYPKQTDNGDVRIYMRVEDLIIEKNEIVESVSETQNKDGSKTKNYSYNIQVDYSIGGTTTFTNATGDILLKPLNLFGSRTFRWSSTTYKNRGEASNYYYNNKAAIISKLVRERMDEAIATVNNYVNYHIGFPVTQVNSFLWLSNGKKHPETEAMEQRWNALKPALQGITSAEITEDTRSKINVMIAYFDELKTRYVTEEKPDKKMRYAAFYNNAVLYLILDQPEKAMEEANGLIANDFDAGDGKSLLKEAEELKALFELNKTKTRHFTR